MNKLTDNDPMPYGKHKGEKLANVPAQYLLWLYTNDKATPEVKQYIEDNKEELKQECGKFR